MIDLQPRKHIGGFGGGREECACVTGLQNVADCYVVGIEVLLPHEVEVGHIGRNHFAQKLAVKLQDIHCTVY